MDEKTLSELIIAANQIPSMLGGKKKPLTEEKVTIDFAFATVVTIKSIAKGEYFTEKNIWVKRPGIGKIPAKDYYKIIGEKATCDIKKDTHVNLNMIS